MSLTYFLKKRRHTTTVERCHDHVLRTRAAPKKQKTCTCIAPKLGRLASVHDDASPPNTDSDTRHLQRRISKGSVRTGSMVFGMEQEWL